MLVLVFEPWLPAPESHEQRDGVADACPVSRLVRRTLVFLAASLAIARGLRVSGEAPGGAPRHF
jgi:hypothetical protein